MAPKKSGAAEGNDTPMGLTENELRFIKAVFDNMTQKPDANWDNVAMALSLKDAKCAKERWRQMSVRHGWREGAAAAGSPRKGGATAGDAKVTKKPRTPRKKAAKKDDDDEEVKSEENDNVKTEDNTEAEI